MRSFFQNSRTRHSSCAKSGLLPAGSNMSGFLLHEKGEI
jgi:hypothetical protein